ncbi:transposon Ty3-G Gag-Pol polyprotein [Trichonephila clavipes]|nr:transposon Ty3-G Gag-Pol polyprotein [Trichonephila clavipes]
MNVLQEIGEQATSKETIIQLKTKLEKSAAFKDDPNFVMNLLNLSVEDRQTKAEHQLEVINSQLETLYPVNPLLHLFKEGAKLELHTDACKLGLGAVLLQQGEDGRFYPIHYMSKKTFIQEEKLCSYELEVLAVIEALKKFRNYLLGRKFRIQTDCAAFAKTLDKKELTPKTARRSVFLTDFDYEVIHCPAKQM